PDAAAGVPGLRGQERGAAYSTGDRAVPEPDLALRRQPGAAADSAGCLDPVLLGDPDFSRAVRDQERAARREACDRERGAVFQPGGRQELLLVQVEPGDPAVPMAFTGPERGSAGHPGDPGVLDPPGLL